MAQLTERELGKAIQELEQVRHDHRNLRQVVQGLAEQQAELALAQARVQARLTTAVSVGVALFGLVGGLINLWRG